MKPTLSKEAIARFAKFAKPERKPQSTKPKKPSGIAITERERAEIVRLRNGRMAAEDIAQRIGRARNTVYKVVAEAVARGECIGMRIERARQ